MENVIPLNNPKNNQFVLLYGSTIMAFLCFIFSYIIFSGAANQSKLGVFGNYFFGFVTFLCIFGFIIGFWMYFFDYPISLIFQPDSLNVKYRKKHRLLPRESINNIWNRKDLFGNTIYVFSYNYGAFERRIVFNDAIGKKISDWFNEK